MTRPDFILREDLDLITTTTILGVLNGIAFMLFCLCTRSLCLQLQEPDKKKQAQFTLAYISLVFLCAMILFIFNGHKMQVAYVNNADFPGGPYAYEGSFSSIIKLLDAAGGLADLAVETLTTAIQIWRLWVIWSGTRFAKAIIVLPTLLLLSYFALSFITNVLANARSPEQLGIPLQALFSMQTAAYAILSAITVLVTGLIVARLLHVRKRHIRIMGTSNIANPYLSIVAMLVESYILDSAWSIAGAVATSVHSPALFLFDNDSIIKAIAYFLVIYRVSTGRGWTTQTERKLTTLQWNYGAQSTRDEANDIRSQPTMATATAVVVGSPSIPRPE